ncbi:hypothetical protein FB45DRAFT_1006445 [Roridomyces roridus]|uniref:Uncharacterized protein n=1 Tax=Roridomyces roridus TaxID=1738132 RepID=A0AAD7FHT6_9AGAR|nr:hypothetical protein FB45DRAFT_1006445 [Roridomyces roridus]
MVIYPWLVARTRTVRKEGRVTALSNRIKLSSSRLRGPSEFLANSVLCRIGSSTVPSTVLFAPLSVLEGACRLANKRKKKIAVWSNAFCDRQPELNSQTAAHPHPGRPSFPRLRTHATATDQLKAGLFAIEAGKRRALSLIIFKVDPGWSLAQRLKAASSLVHLFSIPNPTSKCKRRFFPGCARGDGRLSRPESYTYKLKQAIVSDQPKGLLVPQWSSPTCWRRRYRFAPFLYYWHRNGVPTALLLLVLSLLVRLLYREKRESLLVEMRDGTVAS